MEPPLTYRWIDHPHAFEEALAQLKTTPTLAVDFEMENHQRRYGLHLALIQFSTPDARHYIIDPLAPIPVARLDELWNRAEGELIIHDADFDRRACRQLFGWVLRRVFDTRVAAQFCGMRHIGLADLIRELLGLQIDKSFQKGDWMKRPLSPEALQYAARDSAMLHDLRQALLERLQALGRLEWMQEECRRGEEPPPPEPEEPFHYRIKRSSLLSPRQLAVLGAITAFRDRLAQHLDRPIHYVMRDEILLGLAQSPPDDARIVRQLRGIHPALKRSDFSEAFMQALREGQAAPEEEHPTRQKRAPIKSGFGDRLKAMQAWRVALAAPFDMEAFLFLSNDVLKWCAAHPGEKPPHAIQHEIRDWQRAIAWQPFREHFHIPD